MSELYEKPKKILCADDADFVAAHQLSDNMIEIKRLDQKMIITGDDFSVMVTSPTKANAAKERFTTITATNGKIDEDDLTYKDEQPNDQPPAGKKFKLDDDGNKILDADGNPELEDADPAG